MNNRPSRSKVRSSRSRNEQGITLITTLLLLLLLIGMSLTMVLAVSSESLINGFYGRYRGSFYAADSGVAASRQQLMNLLGANVAAGFNPATSAHCQSRRRPARTLPLPSRIPTRRPTPP